MKRMLILALVAGGALTALYLPLAFLIVAIALAAVVVVTLPDRSFMLLPGSGGNAHDAGYASMMSIWHLSTNTWAAMMIMLAVLSAIGHMTLRRIDEAMSWLTAMFLVAMRGLAAFATMVGVALTSWSIGSSDHRRIASILPA